jgi:outer membrane protein OmpA-like peptidoglycan-associated protein
MLFCLASILYFPLKAQTDQKLERASRFLEIQNFEQAQELFQEIIDEGSTDPLAFYGLGISYYNRPEINEKVKAIPFLEQASQAEGAGIPDDIYYYLGRVYHINTDIKQAIKSYEKYIDLTKDQNTRKFNDIEEQIKVCQNALALISRARDLPIDRLPEPISSPYTEYNPVVSADESLIAYTALRPNREKSGPEFVEEIQLSRKTNGTWGEPESIPVRTRYNVGTAGLSADGEQMIIFIGGPNNTGDLFTIANEGAKWSQPVSLGTQVNSQHLESTASITPDGKKLFFASNRPGGYGGMDIYMAEKDKSGNWVNIENVGATVNTAANEDAPFIHPDGKTLFFTSDGTASMGGKDIFKTIHMGTKWSTPENMGYPINTPANDNYFTLTADAKRGFFSSDRKGSLGGQDIYSLDLPEEELNIPLTMVKGRILAGDPPVAVPTTILVVNKGSGEKIDFVYNPNTKTGNYLIILPPGQNYDMIIESEGYMPYTLNINIPNQTYFFELYQQIELRPIAQFDVIVGQEVIVRNAFYDTKANELGVTPRMAADAMLVQKDSVDLYDLMDQIIAAEDSTAFEYMLDLMYTLNPIEEVSFEESEEIESAGRVYYYDESTEENLEKREIDGRVIFSLPSLKVTEEHQKKKQGITKPPKKPSFDPQLLTKLYKFYFEADESKLNEKYYAVLSEVLDYLRQYDDLGVEISGYASKDGDSDYNRELSNKRAIEVLNYLNFRGIVRRRIVARGYGATGSVTTSKEQGRRVEVKLIHLNPR